MTGGEALETARTWPAAKILPRRPVGVVAFPYVRDSFPMYGKVELKRTVVGARTRGSKTEVLCRYGTAEKWYEVAA